MIFINRYKSKIELYLRGYFAEKQAEFRDVNRWGEDVAQRFLEFALRGKMIRGSLILLANEAYRGQNQTAAVRAASAMEIFHSALLIHDDIFDRDVLRRGKPSMHSQYAELARDRGFMQPEHFGLSLATCAADFGFFMSMDILNVLTLGADAKQNVIKTFYQEAKAVTLAEMEDINFEYLSTEVSEEDILKLYKYKTASYTFSLPLKIGALIAGAGAGQVSMLDKIGEYLGIVFQIKDDELGIYAEESALGKSSGIDIRDNKKTLHRLYLFQACEKDEILLLKKIFGNPEIKDNDLEYVRDLLASRGVNEKIRNFATELENKTLALIGELDIMPQAKSEFQEMVVYNTRRKN